MGRDCDGIAAYAGICSDWWDGSVGHWVVEQTFFRSFLCSGVSRVFRESLLSTPAVSFLYVECYDTGC